MLFSWSFLHLSPQKRRSTTPQVCDEEQVGGRTARSRQGRGQHQRRVRLHRRHRGGGGSHAASRDAQQPRLSVSTVRDKRTIGLGEGGGSGGTQRWVWFCVRVRVAVVRQAERCTPINFAIVHLPDTYIAVCGIGVYTALFSSNEDAGTYVLNFTPGKTPYYYWERYEVLFNNSNQEHQRGDR